MLMRENSTGVRDIYIQRSTKLYFPTEEYRTREVLQEGRKLARGLGEGGYKGCNYYFAGRGLHLKRCQLTVLPCPRS